MAFRMWKKAILMTLREKKLFSVFTLIYTSLIFITSLFWELAITGQIGEIAGYFVLIFLGTSLFLSLLYAWIIVSRNRRTWATLKLVGLLPVVLTSFIFLIVQMVAIILANRKILKVRPIIALKKVGE